MASRCLFSLLLTLALGWFVFVVGLAMTLTTGEVRTGLGLALVAGTLFLTFEVVATQIGRK